jgi:hypothetical protein
LIIRLAERFSDAIIALGQTRYPRTRIFTHVDRDVKSTLDYWLASPEIVLSSVSAGGSTEAQHRPLQALITIDCPQGLQSGLDEREPNFYFPSGNFPRIRRRLLRIAKSLREFPTVDSLYEEILDSFVSNGLVRGARRNRGNHDLPWMAFVSDVELEVINRALIAFVSF